MYSGAVWFCIYIRKFLIIAGGRENGHFNYEFKVRGNDDSEVVSLPNEYKNFDFVLTGNFSFVIMHICLI